MDELSGSIKVRTAPATSPEQGAWPTQITAVLQSGLTLCLVVCLHVWAAQELLSGRRAGVVWRLAGACLRLKKFEKRVMGLVVEALGFSSAAERRKGQEESSSVVTALLQPRITDEGRLHVNVPGARLLECLLRMKPSLSRDLCQAVLSLPSPLLHAVAKDNVASRALLDPLLSHAAQATDQGPQLADQLSRELKGHIADLAGHPVGFHVLTQCFSCAGPESKAAMAQELVAAEGRLAGNHFGRRSLSAMAIPLFKAKPHKWEAAMKQGEKKKKVRRSPLEVAGRTDGRWQARSGADPRSSACMGRLVGLLLLCLVCAGAGGAVQHDRWRGGCRCRACGERCRGGGQEGQGGGGPAATRPLRGTAAAQGRRGGAEGEEGRQEGEQEEE